MTTSFSIGPELKKRIEYLLSGTESISQFCYRAAEERVKRLEARDERARIQTLAKDKELLRETIQEMIDSNMLDLGGQG